MRRFAALSLLIVTGWLFLCGGVDRASADNPSNGQSPQAAATAPGVGLPSSANAARPSAPARSARDLPRPGAAPRVQLSNATEPQVTNQARQALSFYGGYSARATLGQLPRRTPIQSAPPQPMQRQLKPFQTVQATPTISPYHNLNREETADNLPNYFTFVRPQLQQIETNQAQQRDLQRLQRQLGTVSTTVVGPQGGAATNAAAPARFMDTAQFYGGLRR
ncbi:MAG: hypothetical protein L0Z07_03420 [Planctomycetes bacterium]|nr:hypothetical protein [Planctomycetota bacterium]